MKRLYLICVLLLLLMIQTLNSQWISNFGGTLSGDNPLDNAKGLAVTTDDIGNCYVAGYSYDLITNNDILIIKYDENGTILWTGTFDGGSNLDDKAYGIVVDAEGSVYVVGSVCITGKSYEVIVLKYNSEGVLQWGTPYGETVDLRDDKGLDIAVSQNGFIYITGYTTGDNGYANILIQKYNKNSCMWTKTLDGEEHLDSRGYGIVVDETDNIYITGYTASADNSNKIITAKYDTEGNFIWQQTYMGFAGDNQAADLDIDAAKNVYVVGYVSTPYSLSDCILLKYNYDGSLAWSKTHNGTANSEDRGYGIVVDELDNTVIFTGYATNLFCNKDYITISYDLQGNKLWQKTYNGPVFGNDKANAIGLLHDGRIVVTGESKGYGGDFDFATVKYTKSGSLLQVSRYSMTSHSDDRAKGIAVDSSDVVYVTGSSELITDAPNSPSYATTLTLDWSAPDIENTNPAIYTLSQNYPNPFNPTTNISFTILENANVKIKVYDILGRLVQTLVDDNLNIGTYKLVFNGANLSSGTYFYELTTGDFRDIKKMILIK